MTKRPSKSERRTKAPNGAGSIRPRKNKNTNETTYLVRVTFGLVGGKQRQISRVVATAREAEVTRAQLLADVNRGTLSLPSVLTVRELLVEHIDARRAHWKPKTTANNEDLARRLDPLVGAKRVQALKPLDVQRVYHELAGQYGASMLKQVRSLLKGALDFAVLHEIVARNVTAGVPLPKGQPSPRAHENRALNSWQLGAFLQAAQAFEAWAGPVFQVVSLTGLRRGEAAALRWVNVDLDAGVLFVRENLTVVRGRPVLGTPKSAASVRRVPLAPETVALLRAWRARQLELARMLGGKWRGSDHVFTNSVGARFHPDALSRRARLIGEAAGLPGVHFHMLRHTCASLHLARGVPADVVKAWLGHEDIRVTLNTYRMVFESEHRAHVVGLRDLLREKPANLIFDAFGRVGA
ncbi:tyrosine-type recombinase/integrase [Deinococcus yavapaiensis]|uniref:Site-specific recombinase XerD n=1 Tax=Deinococcus yavapaiensis KR-236 TaxID=694435 RepID=A0A318SCD7_9DEIO|nr:site-specific integrase [Deinococcus yavapaiensis]PYE54078.1 site-specific recombinase XerD [Deinococcus yavapaiensis KR-236]